MRRSQRSTSRPHYSASSDASSDDASEFSASTLSSSEDVAVSDAPSSSDDDNVMCTPRRKAGRFTSYTPRAVTPRNARSAPTTPRRRIDFALPDRATPSTVHTTPRDALHASAAPLSLPGREDEYDEILAHVDAAIREHSGLCLYISGVPGTGKTATVRAVMTELQARMHASTLDAFRFVEINGMKCVDPAQAYVELWHALSGDRVPATRAAHLLESRFAPSSSAKGPRSKRQKVVASETCVVLMDELDVLVSKRQHVLYHFFDWPNRPRSRLIVIAIANTMDLPERALAGKIVSRLGLTRINFAPYTHTQLRKIVESRLISSDAFDADAIEFCARKVGAVSGDARRALDICRSAIDLLSAANASQVTVDVVNRAIRAMFASPSVACIRAMSLHQQLFLVATLHAIRKTGIRETTLDTICHQHAALCRFNAISAPSLFSLAAICEVLHASRIILCEQAKLGLWRRVSLNVSEEDAVMALRADPLFRKMLQ